jgi:CubicO group peptidase (beta-lactamase class C family)
VPAVNEANLKSRLDELIKQYGIPGAGVAIWHDGKLHEISAGVTNIKTGVEVDKDTLFLIGSITKTLTTTLIMQLVDSGDLELDKPVASYLPDLALGSDEATKSVTVRNLVTHTSGIPGDYLEDFGRGDDALDRYVKSFSEIGHLHAPNSMISYSNSAFGLAGRLIERVTGKTWDEVLRERLLDPLGMDHTATLAEQALRYRVAIGHRPKSADDPELELGEMWMEFRAGGPAGFTPWAAPRDLIKFAKMHINGGKSESGEQVLSATSAAQMQEIQKTPFASGSWDAEGIGLGFFVFNYGDQRVIGHNGGRSATLRVIPKQNFAVSVLTNASGGTSLASKFIDGLVNELFGVNLPKAPAQNGAVTIDPSRYVGTYQHVGRGIRIDADGDNGIKLVNESLWGINKGDSVPLQPVDEQVFLCAIERGEPAKVSFVEPDGDGNFGYFHIALRAYKRAD